VSAATTSEFVANKEKGKSDKKIMCDNRKENHE
jgi:hypothetical protein